MMLVLGLRRGELLGLAWEDIDVVEATAWIGWQLQRSMAGVYAEVVSSSTKEALRRLGEQLESGDQA